jgi:hypothetical protein
LSRNAQLASYSTLCDPNHHQRQAKPELCVELWWFGKRPNAIAGSLISGTSSFKNKEQKDMAENRKQGEKCLSNKKAAREGSGLKKKQGN